MCEFREVLSCPSGQVAAVLFAECKPHNARTFHSEGTVLNWCRPMGFSHSCQQRSQRTTYSVLNTAPGLLPRGARLPRNATCQRQTRAAGHQQPLPCSACRAAPPAQAAGSVQAVRTGSRRLNRASSRVSPKPPPCHPCIKQGPTRTCACVSRSSRASRPAASTGAWWTRWCAPPTRTSTAPAAATAPSGWYCFWLVGKPSVTRKSYSGGPVHREPPCATQGAGDRPGGRSPPGKPLAKSALGGLGSWHSALRCCCLCTLTRARSRCCARLRLHGPLPAKQMEDGDRKNPRPLLQQSLQWHG